MGAGADVAGPGGSSTTTPIPTSTLFSVHPMRFKFKNKSAKEGCGVRERDSVRGVCVVGWGDGEKHGKAGRKALGCSGLLSQESKPGGDLTKALAVCEANSLYRKSLKSLRKTQGSLQKGPEREGRKLSLGMRSGTLDILRGNASPRAMYEALLPVPRAVGAYATDFCRLLPQNLGQTLTARIPSTETLGPQVAADLDGLSVVDFHHVEVKTVDAFARGDESAAF